MAGEDAEIICLDSSEDEKETAETPQNLPGKVLFEKFVSTCSSLIPDLKKRATMIGLMEKRFNQAREAFQESEEFANILTAHITELETKKKEAFKHILDVVNVLKSATSIEGKKSSKSKHKKTRTDDRTIKPKEIESKSGSDTDKSRSGPLREVTSGSERESTAPESDSYTQLKEEHRNATLEQSASELDTTGQEKNASEEEQDKEKDAQDHNDISFVSETKKMVVVETDVAKAVSEEEQDNEKHEQFQSVNNDSDANANLELNHQVEPLPKPKKKKKVSHRQIRKYERLLHKLSTEIKRLSEKELTLDEMDEEDSTHILEYQLRKRATKVYEKLCELKEVQPKTGRVSERRIKFQGTRFPEINKKLEKLANLPEYFPDFQDVYILISKVNDRKDLRLDRKRMHNIAKDAFEMIGKKLQQRRQEDFLANFSSHPTLDFVEAQDPAELDLELQMKLKTNYKLGSQNLNQIAQSYEKKQESNEQMGVDMEVSSQNSASDASDDDIQAPKKKKRRIDLITVVDDDDDDDDHGGGGSGNEDESQSDDTADETFRSAWADDEDDESEGDDKEADDDDAEDFGAFSPLTVDDGEVKEKDGDEDKGDDDGDEKEKDDESDGAEDFGALSPLTDDDEDEPIDISDEENEEVKSLPPQGDDHELKSDSENDSNAANSNPPDATSNIVSSSDTNMSITNSVDPTPQSVSLNNGHSKNHDTITAGKPGVPVKTSQKDVPNGNQCGSHAGGGDASASAVQV